MQNSQVAPDPIQIVTQLIYELKKQGKFEQARFYANKQFGSAIFLQLIQSIDQDFDPNNDPDFLNKACNMQEFVVMGVRIKIDDSVFRITPDKVVFELVAFTSA